MKRIKLSFLALMFPFLIVAQGGIEIVPFAGYMFGGKIKFYEAELNITNGMDYGISLFIPIQDILDIEVNYTGMSSEGQFHPYPDYLEDYEPDTIAMSTNYFHVGVAKAWNPNNPRLKPFGSLSLGATMFSLKDYGDTWRFSIAAGVGVKYMFTTHIGVMARGRLLLPIAFGGGGGFCGVGSNPNAYCGLSMSGFVQPVQGDFHAGLVIAIGN